MRKVLEARELSLGYGRKKPLIRGLQLELAEGEALLLRGKNGSGKSTVLKALAGLLRPLRGKIYFLERDITEWPVWKRARLGLGTLLQGGRVFPKLTVEENFRLALEGADSSEALEEVLEIFPFLKERWRSRAGLLSGGQRAQLALALLLLRRPRVLLLDEPLAGLDKKTTAKVVQILHELKTREKRGLVIVEHRPEAEALRDKSFELVEGRLLPANQIQNKEVRA